MKLMTKAILKALPPLHSTENVPDDKKIAVVKFFNPTGRGTGWLANSMATTPSTAT